MKKNTLELKDSIHQMVEECRTMVETCKAETREMTEEEEKHFGELKENIEVNKRELAELEKELESEVEVREQKVETEKKEIKNNRNITMKKTLVKELRNALDNGIKSIKVNAETRTMTVGGYTVGEGNAATDVAGVHDDMIETEMQGILEPLYAKSVLTKLGVKWYTGLPMGDIQVPVMGKGNVGWAGEIAEASASQNNTSSIKLSPKRITAYVDYSKQLIY